MKSKCANFNENDEICCDCAAGDVEIRQACYTCFKSENEKKSRRIPLSWNKADGEKVYRIIAEDGDIVVLKEVKQC